MTRIKTGEDITKNSSLDEKFNIFNFLYENGEDYEESLHRAGITEDDIGDKESFKVLADFNKSFAKLVEVFPEAKDKLDVLNIEADILSKIIGNEKDIER